MSDLDAHELLKLILFSRVSDKRFNTSSLKSGLRPSVMSSSTTRSLYEKGYLFELPIDHPPYKWKVLVSGKGQRVVAEADVPTTVLDVFEAVRCQDVKGVISNMFEGELCELLVHGDPLLRYWARQRLNTLLGVEE